LGTPAPQAVPTELEKRIAGLEAVARSMTREQISSFAAAGRNAPASDHWRAGQPYWFSGTAGLDVSDAEKVALGRLWTRMLAGLAFAVSGEEVVAWVARPTLMGRLDRLVQPRPSLRIEGRATAVLERTLGGGVWTGVIGIWNAFCAALLRERLVPGLRSDLVAAWRDVMGGGPEPHER
jgi:hypothetical protein